MICKRTMVFLFLFLFIGLAYAEEGVLIDFSNLAPNYPADAPKEHDRTIVDYSYLATGLPEEELVNLRTSFAVENWKAQLSKSSRFAQTMTNTYVKLVQVRDDAKQHAGAFVMGMRAFFPKYPYDGYLEVTPPYSPFPGVDIKAIDSTGNIYVPEEEIGKGQGFVNYGLLKNVGTVKSIRTTVYSIGYPSVISLVLVDSTGKEIECKMGTMDFYGWNTLEWNNSAYISDVRDRDGIGLKPFYPTSSFFIALKGIRVYRAASQPGDDVIAYIKDVSVVYDKAIDDYDFDIDEERVWGIMKARSDRRLEILSSRMWVSHYELYLEERKKHKDAPNTSDDDDSVAPSPVDVDEQQGAEEENITN